MITMLSGAWGFHSIASRLIPYRVSTALQSRLLGEEPEKASFPLGTINVLTVVLSDFFTKTSGLRGR